MQKPAETAELVELFKQGSRVVNGFGKLEKVTMLLISGSSSFPAQNFTVTHCATRILATSYLDSCISTCFVYLYFVALARSWKSLSNHWRRPNVENGYQRTHLLSQGLPYDILPGLIPQGRIGARSIVIAYPIPVL